MKPSVEKITQAAEDFEALRFFPNGSASAKRVVMEILDRMVSTQEQLDWLMHTMMNDIGEWQGPVELRRVFVQRFKPADGHDPDAGFPDVPMPAIEAAKREALESGQTQKQLTAPRSLTPEVMTAEEAQEVARLKARIHLKATEERVRAVKNAGKVIEVPNYLKGA